MQIDLGPVPVQPVTLTPTSGTTVALNGQGFGVV